MTDSALPQFQQPGIVPTLDALGEGAFDRLQFGVIAFDPSGIVQRYNATEAGYTGLDPHWVTGRHVFTEIAQCMNNYLVAQRFEDAAEAGQALDATIDYVLTWRMRPVKVKLRMASDPASQLRYLLLQRGG